MGGEARAVVASLDRFEDELAVFEDRETGEAIVVPRARVPPDARPGDFARVALGPPGAEPRVVEMLPELADAKRRELAERRDRLRARRGGGGGGG